MQLMIKRLFTLLFTTGLLLFGTLSHAKQDTLIVAGGCFWCVESDFEAKPGVLDVVSGYTGGTIANPTYEQVGKGQSGHYEAVKIVFEDTQVSLQELVEYFWRTIDPTDADGQFCDKGAPYHSALFYQTPQQQSIFEQSWQRLNQTKPFAKPLVTKILPAAPFYPAEAWHQDYYKNNPVRYRYYRWNCGRDQTVQALWGSVASHQYKP